MTRARPLAERLAEMLRPEGTCLVWTGHVDEHGFGVIRDETGRRITVHRVAYQLHHGTTPPVVRQHCGNRACCAILHLYAAAKQLPSLGRHALEMLDEYESGLTYDQLSERYGVSSPTVARTLKAARIARSEMLPGGNNVTATRRRARSRIERTGEQPSITKAHPHDVTANHEG